MTATAPAPIAQETVLTTSNVKTQTFGKRSTFAVQGYVYAQPLYMPGVTIGGTSHNVVFIATEHDQVYAFDVNSGQQLWHTNFLCDLRISLRNQLGLQWRRELRRPGP